MFQIPGQFINFMPYLKLNCSAIFTGGLPFPILNCFIKPSLAISLKALVDHTKCACLMGKTLFPHTKTQGSGTGNVYRKVVFLCEYIAKRHLERRPFWKIQDVVVGTSISAHCFSWIIHFENLSDSLKLLTWLCIGEVSLGLQKLLDKTERFENHNTWNTDS